MNLRIAKSRRGVSLTELLILMSSYSMIMSMCAVLLHRVMRVEIDSRSFVGAERTSVRLSRQFRQDVHQATVVETDGSKLKDNVFLQLQLPDNQTVDYSRAHGNVLRTVSQSGKIAAREEFAFEPTCKLALRQDKSPKRLVLSIASPAVESMSNTAEQLQSYKAIPVGLYVEASIGRDIMAINSIVGQERAK